MTVCSRRKQPLLRPAAPPRRGRATRPSRGRQVRGAAAAAAAVVFFLLDELGAGGRQRRRGAREISGRPPAFLRPLTPSLSL